MAEDAMTDIHQRRQSAQALIEELDSSFFKALAEPVRIEILKYLMLNGQSDVGKISAQMPQDRSVISRHLSLLNSVGLVSCVKQGRYALYDVDSNFFVNKLNAISDKILTCMSECGIPRAPS